MLAISTTSFKNSQFGEIRTLIDDKGEPWFVARDVAISLGYSNVNDAISRHCKGVVKHDHYEQRVSGSQPINIIPESDMYRLILRSKLPQAEAFQDWVTEEILPSIRKHGVYSAVQLRVPEGLTRASFIEHDGCFWLDVDTIVRELEHIGVDDGDGHIEVTMDEHGEFLSNYTANINGKDCFRDYGILYLLLTIAVETKIEQKDAVKQLVMRIEKILESLKGKDLAGVRIAAVRAYQEVVNKIASSGRDIEFIRNLVRYKNKDLSVDEISVLTGYSVNDVAVYLEELETSGIMETAELLTAAASLPASPAPCLPVLSVPTQEMIDSLGYNEAVVLHQLQVMIQQSGKSRIQLTYSEWMKKFPFKSEETLQRTVRNLEKKGLVNSRRVVVGFQRIKEYWV